MVSKSNERRFYGELLDTVGVQLIDHIGIVWEPRPGHRPLAGGPERGLDFRPAPPITRRLAWCLHVRESINRYLNMELLRQRNAMTA